MTTTNPIMNADVVIVGGGSGGMAAAYALLGNGYKVVVVEREAQLGGTAVSAWVHSWIPGVNIPPVAENFNALLREGNASGTLAYSQLNSTFANWDPAKTSTWMIDVDALARKYASDFSGNVRSFIVLCSTSFVSATVEGRNVRSIDVRLGDGTPQTITASWFIDASADGALCRAAGSSYYTGEDPYCRFKESMMPTDNAANPDNINEPTQFFQIGAGVDDHKILDPITTVSMPTPGNFQMPGYVFADGYPEGGPYYYVNAMTGMSSGNPGIVLQENYEKLKVDFQQVRQYEYWKYLKLVLSYYNTTGVVPAPPPPWPVWQVRYCTFGHTGKYAPMVGIRESYRIVCQSMMCQSDLAVLLTKGTLGNNIAIGSHPVDLHVLGNVLGQQLCDFNTKALRPSGIRYESLLPVAFDNVIIGSRCYGSSHIHLAARRVIKDMTQLGWAAGHATRMVIDGKLSSYASVDVSTLQGADYTGFADTVAEIETLYKSGLK